MTIMKDIENKLGNAPVLLGDLFACSINVGTTGVRHDEMVQLFTAKLDAEMVPEPIAPLTAAQRAVEQVCKQRKLDRKVVVNEYGAKVWAIVDTSVSPDAQRGDSVGTLENRVLFNRITEELLFEHQSPMADEIFGLYTEWTSYLNGKDVRGAVHNALNSMGAIRTLGGGGQYFIGAEHADQVRALRDVVNGIADSEAMCIPLPDVDDAKAGLGMSARKHLAEELFALRAEVQRWQEGARKPRASSLEGRIESYQELSRRMSDLHAMLGIGVTDLQANLDELRQSCEALLTGKAPQTELPKAEPVQEVAPEPEPEPEPEPKAAAPAKPEPPKPPAKPASPDNGESVVVKSLGQYSIAQLRKMASRKGIATKGLKKNALLSALEAVL